MARRKKGRPVDGWMIIDKPEGVTSTAVVGKVRWAFQARKAGHAGTLDPLATGVLAVALGEATKTIPIAQEGLKTYLFTVRLGIATTTDDAEGEVMARVDARPSDDEIAGALTAFEGDIMQVPPQFSAVKVAGERAYDLARGGEVLDLAARPLWVESIRLVSRPDPDHVEIEMICGKGGYVRSVARDLGAVLGCHGHVVALRRLASGGFHIAEAVGFDALDAIRAADGTSNALLPVTAGLTDLPCVHINRGEAAQLRNGQQVALAVTTLGYGDTAWAACDGAPVAICTYRSGILSPMRVFAGPEVVDQPK